MKQYVMRAGIVRALKDGVDLKDYLAKNPTAYQVGKPPTIATLTKWSNDGVAKAVDGCRVEPDGTCQHGKPSWILAMGLI